MGRFALCIPDGSDGTRALPPCSVRRWQVAGTAGPYLGFWALAFLLRLGPATGKAATGPPTQDAARRSFQSVHGSAKRWDEIPEPAGCGNQGGSFTNRGSWPRGAGLHHGTWGSRQWMIGCSTIAFTPAPMGQVLLLGSHALASVIPGRSRMPLLSRCRCLSALGVTTTDAAAASLAPSATAGTDG